MSGHEFEKQVRQKLNDLKMIPSAEAWENIENKLREHKRRPVAFYWLPLLLVGLAAGGYLLLNNDDKSVLSHKNSTPYVNAHPKPSGGNAVSSEKNISPEKNKSIPEGINKNDASGVVLPAAPQEKFDASGVVSPEKSKNLSEGENKSDAAGGFYRNVAPEGNINSTEEAMIATQANTNAPQKKNAYGKNLSLKISKYPIGSITPSPLNFSQTAKKSQSKNLNRWSYGISAFIGISAVNEGHLLNFNNAQVEDVSLVPSFAPRPSYTASSISPGLSYSGGLFVKRQMNRKFSLSLGVNYLQLNTRNKVGDREYGNQMVNAGANGYQFVYSYFRVEADKTSEYHNRYHFIEVPLELHTRLNKSEKIPVQLTCGVAVSQLLKSTSLHFDGTTGVYYKDDRLLNQTQVAAKTGVSVGILNKSKRPLWVGPSAKYNISKILEKDLSARTNFMSIGVDVKMFIK
jgi:hypothetical protein